MKYEKIVSLIEEVFNMYDVSHPHKGVDFGQARQGGRLREILFELAPLAEDVLGVNGKDCIVMRPSTLPKTDHKEAIIQFYSSIEKRVDHFNAHHHTYEAAELAHALNAIRRLVPPSYFTVGEEDSTKQK